MYCSQLLALKDDLPKEEVDIIDKFLNANQYNPYITVSMAKKYTNLPETIIAEIFNKLSCAGVLTIIYAISCPECGHLIKVINKVETFDFEEIDYCDSCMDVISVSKNDVVILYRQNQSFFRRGQYPKNDFVINPCDIAPCDTYGIMESISETFREMLALKKSELDEIQAKEINKKKIEEVKNRAFKIYICHKRIQLVLRCILILLAAYILWEVLQYTKATNTASVAITVTTFIITNIVDLLCNWFIDTDYVTIEKKQLLKYNEWLKKQNL